MAAFVEQHQNHARYGAEVKALGAAQEAVVNVVMKLMEYSQTGQLPKVPLVANRFLEMMGELTVSWLLLDQAMLAEAALEKLPAEHPDRAFYLGKRYGALFFARNVLPGVTAKASVVVQGDESPYEIPDAAFATV